MADSKLAYGSSSALTITLASLASSSTLLAGRESTAIDNTTNKYRGYLLGGTITTGTSPTASKRIQVWAVAQIDDTPTYPDVFDGTDSAETWTSADIRDAGGRLVAEMGTDSTSDRPYWFAPVNLAKLFGDVMPKRVSIFVTHDTGVNLNSTAGNHVLTITPFYETVA